MVLDIRVNIKLVSTVTAAFWIQCMCQPITEMINPMRVANDITIQLSAASAPKGRVMIFQRNVQYNRRGGTQTATSSLTTLSLMMVIKIDYSSRNNAYSASRPMKKMQRAVKKKNTTKEC